MYFKCVECDGTGISMFTWDEEPCTPCSGEGEIWEAISREEVLV